MRETLPGEDNGERAVLSFEQRDELLEDKTVFSAEDLVTDVLDEDLRPAVGIAAKRCRGDPPYRIAMPELAKDAG